MPEAAEFTPEEQKYFDTKGADGPANDGTPAAPDIEPETPPENNIGQKDAEEAKEPDEKDNPGKFVRHGAFHEERERRKAVERAFEQERIANAERNARLEERLSILARNFAPEQPQREPNPLEDLNELKQWKQQREAQEWEQNQVSQQLNQFASAVMKGEAEFYKEHPDYYEAVEFAKQARVDELNSFGIFDETRIATILAQDIQGISVEALRRGHNPAEVYYNYAKHHGYAHKPAAPAPAEKLKTIAAGQNAGKSLSQAAGTAAPGAPTLEALASMSDDDFAKIALNKKEWRKMMGG